MNILSFLPTDTIMTRMAYSAGIIICGSIVALLSHRIIDVLFIRVQGRIASQKFIAKTVTLRSLVKNTIDVVVFAMAFFIILSHWGINILPLLTGAGIIGLAISFGSQTIIKDMLNGFFIIVEDQYNIGDKVIISEKQEGIVEELTLRLTILRGSKKEKIFIPNSQITSVTRFPKEAN